MSVFGNSQAAFHGPGPRSRGAGREVGADRADGQLAAVEGAARAASTNTAER